MNRKSETCYGKKTNRPLAEYDSRSDALEGADYARRHYRQDLVPYECGECGFWHLSPADRQTPSTKCPHCIGADGRAKDSYRTEGQARRRADILQREQDVALKVYPCQYGNGWHLTRSFR